MTGDDLSFADVVTLGRLLRRRSISAVELTRHVLDRLERYGPKYGAVVTVMHDRALAEARRADRELRAGHDRGPLHGIPYGAKDMFAARGAPTTWGMAPYRRRVFDFDAAAIERLRDAGAVLAAKLAMIEVAGGFGYNDADASFTGPARTPWNREYWAGGSSSGSGAAVAAGLVPFALGSETCGSITFPATSCGVTGLRPTFGGVSRYGAMALCWTLDKIGPLARTARDAEIVWRALAGSDPRDPATLGGDRDRQRLRRGRRPRIGVLQGATRKTMPSVRANFKRTLDVFGEFCDIVEDVPFPDFPYDATVQAIVDAEGAAAHRSLIESGKARALRSADDRIGGYVAYATLAVDYIDAQRMHRKIGHGLRAAFAGYEAILSPTLAHVAYPIGTRFDRAYPEFPGYANLIAPGNLAGIPAIAFPNGFGPHGLPTGVSLVGRAGGEAAIAALARAFQSRNDVHRARPELA